MLSRTRALAFLASAPLPSAPFALSALAATLAACSAADAPVPAPQPAAVGPAVVRATAAHHGTRAAVPSFYWLARSGAPFRTAQQATSASLEAVMQVARLDDGARRSLLATPLAIDAEGSLTLATVKQSVRGLEVFRGGLTLALKKGTHEPVVASGLLARSTEGSDRPFAQASRAATATALARMGLADDAARELRDATTNGATEYDLFDGPRLRVPARAKRVLFPAAGRSTATGDADGRGASSLEPAHYVEVELRSGAARSFVVSAVDGRVLFDNDLVRYDAPYTYRVWADPTTFFPYDGPQGNAFGPHPTGKPDGTKLTNVASQLVSLANLPFSNNDPWLPAKATTTAGNNVVAYADLADPDGFGAGDAQPPVTASKLDFTYDVGAGPAASVTSQRASITQLFYVTNFMHDWFYDAGYNEAAKNHQTDNFGRGGQGGDPLLAEAQDASGRNNANATVPRDGRSPRLQMFVFSGVSEGSLTVTAPATIAGVKPVGIASGYGKDLFNLTAPVVLGVDDGGADPNDGCEPLNGAAGKIVLVHRGTCSFAQKAQNAQTAGAAGILIANVATSAQPTTPPFMGGTATGINIPMLSLALADGQALEAAVAQTPVVTMKRTGGVDLDGALDTSIVTHEWGHVLSGRLVGDGNGLNTNQAGGLGEGWADFVALLVAAREDGAQSYGGVYTNGSYATSGSGDDIYFGTRRVPYSVDFTKNPLTLKHIQNGVALPSSTVPVSFGEDGSFNAEVHNTGEVWATMLWECYVALLRDKRYSFKEAQERMKRYLVASLKLTPVDPTLLEARDAVLGAAMATDEADAKLFWQAFARRGAGAGAEGPPKESASNIGVVESFYAGNGALITDASLKDDGISCDHDGELDEGEVGTVSLTVKNAGAGTLTQAVARITTATEGVTLFETGDVPLPPLKPFASTTLKLKVQARAKQPLDVVALDVDLVDPSFDASRPTRVTIPTRYQSDEAGDSSAVDHVETTATSWKPAASVKDVKWTRDEEGGNHFWSVPNGTVTADTRLISAPFRVDGTTLTISYRHRWSFRFSTRRGVDQDGGVVELSLDDGASWKDLSEYGVVDYNTKLDTGSRGNNPLKGQRAYGNKSPGYPLKWVDSKVTASLPAPAEKVRLRFRAGNGDAFTTSAVGWHVDDIAIEGAASTPFFAFVPHVDSCDPAGPTVSAGANKTVHPKDTVRLEGSGSHPADKALTFIWRQVAGPAVELRDANGPTPSFEAPGAPTTLGFELRAHDDTLLSAAAHVSVTVVPVEGTGAGDDESCSCRTAGHGSGGAPRLGVLGLGAAAALLFARRRTRRRRSART